MSRNTCATATAAATATTPTSRSAVAELPHRQLGGSKKPAAERIATSTGSGGTPAGGAGGGRGHRQQTEQVYGDDGDTQRHRQVFLSEPQHRRSAQPGERPRQRPLEHRHRQPRTTFGQVVCRGSGTRRLTRSRSPQVQRPHRRARPPTPPPSPPTAHPPRRRPAAGPRTSATGQEVQAAIPRPADTAPARRRTRTVPRTAWEHRTRPGTGPMPPPPPSSSHRAGHRPPAGQPRSSAQLHFGTVASIRTPSRISTAR